MRTRELGRWEDLKSKPVGLVFKTMVGGSFVIFPARWNNKVFWFHIFINNDVFCWLQLNNLDFVVSCSSHAFGYRNLIGCVDHLLVKILRVVVPSHLSSPNAASFTSQKEKNVFCNKSPIWHDLDIMGCPLYVQHLGTPLRWPWKPLLSKLQVLAVFVQQMPRNEAIPMGGEKVSKSSMLPPCFTNQKMGM